MVWFCAVLSGWVWWVLAPPSHRFSSIGTVSVLIGRREVSIFSNLAIPGLNAEYWHSMQKRIQLKTRQRAAKKRAHERREATKLVQQRKVEEQRQAAIKIQAASKGKRDRVSDRQINSHPKASMAIQLCRIAGASATNLGVCLWVHHNE